MKTIDVILTHNTIGGYESIFECTMEPYICGNAVVIGRGTATFNMLEHAEIVNNQIAAIEQAKTDLQASTGAKLAQLDAQIQNLLAITHDGGAA